MDKYYYAIENTGRYYLIKAIRNNWVIPVDGKAYKKLDDALARAKELRLDIEVIGDTWQILKNNVW